MTRVSVDDDGFPSVPVPRRVPTMPEYPQVHYELRFFNSFGERKSSSAVDLAGIEFLLRVWGISSDRELRGNAAMRNVHIVRVTSELVETFEFTKGAEL